MTISTSLPDISELHQDDVERLGPEAVTGLPSNEPLEVVGIGMYGPLGQKGFTNDAPSVPFIVYSGCAHSEILTNLGAGSLVGKFGIWNEAVSMTPGLSHKFGALVGPTHSVPRLFSLAAAERRLAEIQALTTPSLFSKEDEDHGQLPLTDAAISRARKLFRALDAFPPIRHIGIFPMPNGGIQLQRSGEDSSISIEIPPDGLEPVLIEFASDDTYWSKCFHSLVETTLMLARHLR
ncbi:hypothetical protein ACXPWS_13605 [Mycobacterium sp. BMJ-28]